MTSSTPPPPFASRALGAVAMIAALALLALVVAHWGWRWFAPALARHEAAPPASAPLERIAAAHLFGASPGTPRAPNEPVAAGDLRLLGVLAQAEGKGYALFRQASRGPVLVAAGGEVAPGVRVEAVRPDGVTLLDGGTRRDIALRAAAVPKAKPAATGASASRVAACTVPAGFSGPIVRLNAELLGGMINTPGAWKGLVQTEGGALVVRDETGFAGMMSLKSGDRVERANGIALMIPDDITSAVLKPLSNSQPVWVLGAREGKPQQWLYLNAGSCPAA
ncbi:MAG TPA: type II secretion system protein N [Casimicrobiaceae bacterium]|nr:type II secretion system protein N [Casimicrobiaceae bacterium]